MIDAGKNMDEVFFRYFEGDLSKEEMQQVDILITNDSELQKEFLYWKSSYLTDPNLSYPKEKDLLRKSHFPKIWIFVTSILIIGTTGWFAYHANYADPSNTPSINNQETPATKQEDPEIHQQIDSFHEKQNHIQERIPSPQVLPADLPEAIQKQNDNESAEESMPIIQLDDVPSNSEDAEITLDSTAIKRNRVTPLYSEPKPIDTIKKKVKSKKNIFKDTKVIPLE